MEVTRASAALSESGFSGLAGFSGFHFSQLTLFAKTGNPAKTNRDKRLPTKDAIVESCKSYNPVNPDSDKTPAPVIPAKAGNPETNNVILAKAGTSQPSEAKPE